MQRISVIIPNYNHALYLKERIDSVLNQTYSDFEIIILDDCSTDNSREVIESYRDNPKVSHIVYNEQNSGSTFKQWKKGIELAQGEWVWIAESDDVAGQKFLETLLAHISLDNHLVLAFSSSMEINSYGEDVKVVNWAYDISDRNWEEDYTLDGISEIKSHFFYKNIIPNASAVLFKKSAVDISVFNTIQQMKFAGDWLFWVKLLEKGGVFYSSKIMNYFRYHDNTTRHVKTPMLEQKRFEEYFRIINYMQKKYDLSLNWKKHVWILDEWITKFYVERGEDRRMFNSIFPLKYNVVLFLKICLIRFRNLLK